MCGIAGIYARSPALRENLAAQVSGMVQAIRHRGPDSSGLWCAAPGDLALGHSRLAIVDLTEEGKQPMVSPDGNLVLVFNGEIYNYVELREQLIQTGVRFRGTSDTEVLLEAIESWGLEEALRRSRGMFALAVLDRRERRLSLARDRVGKKPLYFYEEADRFAFSSEIKGLLAVPGIRPSLSTQAVSDYLSLGFVPGPGTIYREISEVEPGTLLHLSLDTGRRREQIYWRFPREAALVLSRDELEAEVERRLDEAVRLRLRADVPVGVFLSGGIDSGLITALASRHSTKPLQTFTVSFGAAAFDESGLARQVAERYGTDHHEFRLEPDLTELLPRVVRAYDEPFGDPSALPTFAIAREAARHVKVVLNGEGSDELFGGYRRIYAMRQLQRLQPLLRQLPAGTLAALLRVLPRPRGFRNAYAFFYRFLRAAQADPTSRYLLWSTDGFSEQEKHRLSRPESPMATEPTAESLRRRLLPYAALPALAEFMAIDFLVGLTDCLLPKIDIATMAHGLEGRSPFLDQELVGWAAGLDKLSLLSGGGTKPVLRALARKHLPEEIARAPKRGFEIPLIRWMTHDLRPMVREVCLAQDGLLFELFERREITDLLDRRGPLEDERWAKRVWLLFMLASWGAQRT